MATRNYLAIQPHLLFFIIRSIFFFCSAHVQRICANNQNDPTEFSLADQSDHSTFEPSPTARNYATQLE